MVRTARQAAFSMIELMIVLAIAAVLMALAVPNFKTTIDRQKITTASGDLYAAIGLTRAEAIRRGMRVDLKAISSNWQNGWTISVTNGAGVAEKIYSHSALPTGVKVAPPAFGDGVADDSVSYDGTGRARLKNDGLSVVNGVWTFTIDDNPAFKRTIEINTVGRPHLCDPTNPTGC